MNRPWLSHYHVASRAAYPVHPVSGFLESAARRTPDKLAVLDGRERATYRELAQRVAHAVRDDQLSFCRLRPQRLTLADRLGLELSQPRNGCLELRSRGGGGAFLR